MNKDKTIIKQYKTEIVPPKTEWYWSSVFGAWVLGSIGGILVGWITYHLFLANIIFP